MKFIEHLKVVYEGFDQKWIELNRFVIETAMNCGAAFAGSIALSIGVKKAKKDPLDLDFVVSSPHEAMAIISALQIKLLQYSAHWRVYVNHRTDYVPPGCITHFRFQSAFWLPICIMVIPVENFRFWYAHGLRVQLFDGVKKAAELLSEIDDKDRTLIFEEELPVEESSEHATEDYDFESEFRVASKGRSSRNWRY